ncbi:MAG: amino-acid N-acetyltransferase [Pseudomonadota bacterium]|nr:amino-acid N-acetyltransferase [Pseudomonadota bacterium]
MDGETRFVNWFRDAAPYIQAHRDRTFVIYFSGEAVADGSFSQTIHDFAILNSLGIRLVLVHGMRPQINQRLEAAGLEPSYHKGIRITDTASLQCVKEAAGTVRIEIEALLSMGLSNSPLTGTRTRVCTGNFVTARPLGVKDGIDFCHTGEIRRIDCQSIGEKLNHNNIIVVSPIGNSPTGEVFNLSAESLSVRIAVELVADKLIFLTEAAMPLGEPENPIRQLTTIEAKGIFCRDHGFDKITQRHLELAVEACDAEVGRVHLINRRSDGAIFEELFSRDGVGTLVSSTPFEVMRTATLQDLAGILDLITPLEQQGVLVKRGREVLETEIGRFTVIDRDGLIIGCAALYPFASDQAGELGCIAIHDEYAGAARGTSLLEYVEKSARSLALNQLFVLTTQATHWFRERGFELAGIDSLPTEKQGLYNFSRNSKVLCKKV